MHKYIVIRDNNEKEGWHFQPSDLCECQIVQSLNTGDYTLRGLEDKFIIERKGKVSEVAKNIVQPCFERELERLEMFENPFMILEFELMDIMMYPKTSDIPPRMWDKVKIKPQFLLAKMAYYSINYSTKIIFAGNYGYKIAEELMRKAWQKYN